MIKKIMGTDIHYEFYENPKKPTLVYLHGWGQNISMMAPLANPFTRDYQVLLVDLAGHGESSEPPIPWTVFDYVQSLKELIDELKIKNPILIGHSFGGKVSLAYASKYETQKLILFAPPFKKEVANLSLKTKTLKTLKKVPGLNKLANVAKRHIGSSDYRNASNIMREILVLTVNLDITCEVKKIKAPTLLIWGTDDSAVNIRDAYLLESLLADAAVIVYENCTHYAYLEDLPRSIRIIDNFINS